MPWAMIINADLHIHGRFSGGTSSKMTLANISKEARKKGIELVATGDCLHSGWMREIRELNKIDDGTFEKNETRFILSTEVEDTKRVHHLIFFPSLSSVEEFKDAILKKSANLDSDGRPNLYMSGREIAQLAKDVDGMIGPCHAFTPWTAVYAYHDSLKSCYADLLDYISFVELGLSADSDYADRIAELENLTFLTNSDSHSPYPVRLAREFNRFKVEDVTFDELKKAILREGKRKVILNVGLPPQEGKYNESACIKCFTHYSINGAKARKWRCSCGGRIKKGVRDRVEELADYPEPRHPEHRPPYLHLIPLAEIIAKALNHSSPYTKKVFEMWNELIKAFGNEVSVLVDADIEEINKVTESEITHAIKCFRENKVIIHPGGGGQYGRIELPRFNETPRITPKKKGQMSLSDY